MYASFDLFTRFILIVCFFVSVALETTHVMGAEFVKRKKKGFTDKKNPPKTKQNPQNNVVVIRNISVYFIDVHIGMSLQVPVLR